MSSGPPTGQSRVAASEESRRVPVGARSPGDPAAAMVLVVAAPIERSDIPGLCARVCRLLDASDATTVVCDVGAHAADAVTLDALARLQLAASRRGKWIELHHTRAELRALLELTGLGEVLTFVADE
jgi:ABC-type transporter Mla MlaB component